MSTSSRTVRVFTMPQQFPCGPQSSCCGPIGQSEEEVNNIRSAIEKETGCRVEVINAMNGPEMKNHLSVVRLVRSFGPWALPVITLDDDVASMGNLTPEEAVSAVKERMNQGQASASFHTP